MTAENPRLGEGFDQEPGAERDPFRSLGFGFPEESPISPVAGGLPAETEFPFPAAAAPLSNALMVTAPQADSPRADASEPAPLSRRALREAERAAPASRRARRSTSAESDSSSRPATAPSAARPASPTRTAPRRAAHAPTPSFGRRVAQKAFPPAVMLAVASLLVGTSVPANALFDPDAPPASLALSSVSSDVTASSDRQAPERQVLEAQVSQDLAASAASRDNWSVTSYAEVLRLKYGNRNFSYSTTGTGAVRWPFPYAVPISSGFGERVAPCRWCSSYHQGIDFTPGAGTPIFAIADGVVLQAERSGGFGQHALIEHVINGQRVVSVYAHMTAASSPLVVGQVVEAGDFVGTVGNTGTSTGAHLHFEIRIDDIPIDPFDWLSANAS